MHQALTYLRKSKATHKLVASYVLFILIAVVLGYVGVSQSVILGRVNRQLFDRNLTGISNIKEAAIFEAKCSRVLRDAVLAIGDKEAVEDQRQNLAEMEDSAGESLSAAEKALTSADSKSKLDEIRAALPKLHDLSISVVAAAQAGDRPKSLAALKEASSLASSVNLKIAEICRQQEEEAGTATHAAQLRVHSSIVLLLSLLSFSFLVASGFSYWMVRLISRPLQEVARVLQLAAKGDFRERPKIPGEDEFAIMARELGTALSGIESAISEVSQTARGLTAHTGNIARTALELANSSSEQLSELHKALANVIDVTTTTRQNAEKARTASELASTSRVSAERGESVVRSAVDSMDAILDASSQISGISSAMDDVAFQTKLLALNAAIEAARAGEHGLAFSVVAAEVRSLAEKSAESSHQITELVNNASEQISHGSDLVNKSGSSLTEIMGSVKQLAELMQQIAEASEEQTIGVQTVGQTLTQFDSVMQKNLERSEALSSTAKALDSEAAHLDTLVSCFSLSASAPGD